MIREFGIAEILKTVAHVGNLEVRLRVLESENDLEMKLGP